MDFLKSLGPNVLKLADVGDMCFDTLISIVSLTSSAFSVCCLQKTIRHIRQEISLHYKWVGILPYNVYVAMHCPIKSYLLMHL